MVSQGLPAEVKPEEPPPQSKDTEVSNDAQNVDATATPIEPKPQVAKASTPAPTIGLPRHIVETIESVIHEVVSFKSEE